MNPKIEPRQLRVYDYLQLRPKALVRNQFTSIVDRANGKPIFSIVRSLELKTLRSRRLALVQLPVGALIRRGIESDFGRSI